MWVIFFELAIALPLVLLVLYALHKGKQAPDRAVDGEATVQTSEAPAPTHNKSQAP